MSAFPYSDYALRSHSERHDSSHCFLQGFGTQTRYRYVSRDDEGGFRLKSHSRYVSTSVEF